MTRLSMRGSRPLGPWARLGLGLAAVLLTTLGTAKADGEARERLLARYEVASWPKPSPSLTGVPVLGLRVPGWRREKLVVDPRRGEAVLTLAPAWPLGSLPARVAGRAIVHVRLHATPEEAREELLARLGQAARPLERVPVGEPAFAAIEPRTGRCQAALGVHANVSFGVTAAGKALDVRLLAAWLAKALSGGPRVAQDGASAPRRFALAALEADEDDGQGGPLPLRLRAEGDAKPAFLAFSCSEGAAIVTGDDGRHYLFCSRPGRVEVEVFAASASLVTATLRTTIEIEPR